MSQESLFVYAGGRLFRQIVLAIGGGVVLLSLLSVLLTFGNFKRLGEQIGVRLAEGRDNAEILLERSRAQLAQSVDGVKDNAGQALTSYLGGRLGEEMAVMKSTLHEALGAGVESTADLLAAISQDAILGRNYSLLNNLAKTVSGQEAVLYAVFFKPDGKPFTRYVNRSDPRIKALVEQGNGRSAFDRLFSVVARAPSVHRVSRDIRTEGKLLGRVELGVTTVASDRALKAMEGRMGQLIDNSRVEVRRVLDRETAALSAHLDRNFAGIQTQNQDMGKATLEAIGDTAGTLVWEQVGVAGLAGLVILGALFFFILGRVIAPIRRLADTMEDIASGEGDLTRRLPESRRDEIGGLGAAFNHFVAKIQEAIAQAGESTQRLATAAQQLARVADQNSGSANAQQSETQQVATAITEMAATVKEVARSAESAAEAARKANGEADEGKQVVTRTMGRIDALAGEVRQAAEVINRLEADSMAIGTVLDVIRNIAEQTNLLALNAAIEAARAGEQGRGFAVVAEEVRSLASRTQESTREIQSMIERVQDGTRKAVSVMNSGVAITGETVEQAAQAGTSLDHIVTMVATITDMNNQIASAAEEQTLVAGEIDRSVVHISELSQHAAQGTGQIAQASRELAELGEALRKLVSQFRV